MHADLVNHHSSRCDRIRRICEDATTIRPEPGIRRSLFHSVLAAGLMPSLSFIGFRVLSCVVPFSRKQRPDCFAQLL
jgi:hypothetical protein